MEWEIQSKPLEDKKKKKREINFILFLLKKHLDLRDHAS